MDDERDKQGLVPDTDEGWAKAFATIEERDNPTPPTPEGGDGTEAVGDGTAPADGEAVSADGGAPGVDPAVGADDAGGPVPGPGEAGAGDDDLDVEATIKEHREAIGKRAIDDTAQLFLEKADDAGNKLVRQSDGKLGATISDPDIYRVDESTGAATFYNPDTGKPFTGDNPRAQAKQWVEMYNEELRETFNQFVENRETELAEEAGPAIRLLEFVPTFDALDPVRQQMLDALIEDYEIKDSEGDVIGYSVDLDSALTQVNRQVASIQANQPKAEPTTPAVDMPTSGSAPGTGESGPPKTLAEAIALQEDNKLAALKDKK